jgi:hypothetical protein
MSLLTIGNLLLIFSMISFVMHAYFHNTIDFTMYRARMAIPVSNAPMKYIYINSFFICAFSIALFLFNVVASAFKVNNPVVVYSSLGISILLALLALRLITLPQIGQWPKRAQ